MFALMYERSAMSKQGSGPTVRSSGIYSWDLVIRKEGGRKDRTEDGCVGEDMEGW